MDCKELKISGTESREDEFIKMNLVQQCNNFGIQIPEATIEQLFKIKKKKATIEQRGGFETH